MRSPRLTASVRAALPSRDAAVVVAGVAGLTALAWLDLVRIASGMAKGMGMAMTISAPVPWMIDDLLANGVMWSIMMVAMMLPSATPMLLLFSGAQRTRRATGQIAVPAGLFAAGFVLVWLGLSWCAAGMQWTFQAFLVLSPQLAVTRFPLAIAFLIVAGVYQFTPLKHACLARCQSPLGFLMTQWREGPGGALRMGARYGAYCVGCCWTLMGLLFVVGIMNMLWIVLLAIFVLIEKLVVRGPWLARVTGVALIVWALYLLRAGLPG
ncbi:MAG: DUF2182 domain-containing protein [bacterium]